MRSPSIRLADKLVSLRIMLCMLMRFSKLLPYRSPKPDTLSLNPDHRIIPTVRSEGTSTATSETDRIFPMGPWPLNPKP